MTGLAIAASILPARPDPAAAELAAAERDGAGLWLGWIAASLFFGLFLGWATFVRLDAAATASGTIAVSGDRQVVQHRDGGVVSAIQVREGQRVRAGEVLIELSPAEVAASERALAAQVIGLKAERARILAERGGEADFAAPSEFAALTGADRADADRATALQRAELATRRRSLGDQKRVLAQQSVEIGRRIAGLNQQIATNREQGTLYSDELRGMQQLAAQGYASRNRVRALERAEAATRGDTASIAANAASAREQQGETRLQAASIASQYSQKLAEEQRQVETALNDATPRWRAAREQLDKTRIRATASGQVVGLSVTTVGGVVAPGQRIMEIVPDRAELVVQATVSPNDADDLHVGQQAELRVTALHERDLPIFMGRITRLSADSFINEQTGQRFFTAEIRAPDVFRRAGHPGGGPALRPGLPVEVLVPLRRRSLLQYLVEPIDQALWRTMREH